MELQEVTFNKYYKEDKVVELEQPFHGYFHRWADEPIYLDEKYFNRTFGIVSDDHGRCYSVPTDTVHFIYRLEGQVNHDDLP